MKFRLLNISILIVCLGCIRTPNEPERIYAINIKIGDILILCEGLQGYDNSAISYINSATGKCITEAYSHVNKGIRLGDTANDMVPFNDTLYVCSTIGNFIEIIDIKSLRTIRRIELSPNSAPRNLVVDSSFIYCTLLYESSLLVINKFTNELKLIPTGPQPEGLALLPENIVITANSAYGDFNAHHLYAGTISIIDLQYYSEIKKIYIGPNVCEVLFNPKNNRVYAVYYNLPSKPNSLGGIVELSYPDFTILRKWYCQPFRVNLSFNGDSLYFISQKRSDLKNTEAAISFIDLQSGTHGVYQLFKENDIYYALTVSPFDGSIWVGNALNHQTNGYIFKVNPNGPSVEIKFDVSLNPNRIVFVR